MLGSLCILLFGNTSRSESTRSRKTLIEGAVDKGGLNSDGFASPECTVCEVVCKFKDLLGLDRIYL